MQLGREQRGMTSTRKVAKRFELVFRVAQSDATDVYNIVHHKTRSTRIPVSLNLNRITRYSDASECARSKYARPFVHDAIKQMFLQRRDRGSWITTHVFLVL